MSLTESLSDPPPRDASDVLREIAAKVGAEGTPLNAALAAGDKRGFALFFLFAFVLLFLPIDSLFPQIAALTLIVCALGMIGGAAAPWLPGFIGKRTVKHDDLIGFAKLFEAMAWSKLILSPRNPELAPDKLVGLVVLLLGVVVAPIGMPDVIPALALLALALGLMQRDGLITLIGLATGVGWLAFVAAMIAGYATHAPYGAGWVEQHMGWLAQSAIFAKEAAPN